LQLQWLLLNEFKSASSADNIAQVRLTTLRKFGWQHGNGND
jgi:hypothetical protein